MYYILNVHAAPEFIQLVSSLCYIVTVSSINRVYKYMLVFQSLCANKLCIIDVELDHLISIQLKEQGMDWGSVLERILENVGLVVLDCFFERSRRSLLFQTTASQSTDCILRRSISPEKLLQSPVQKEHWLRQGCFSEVSHSKYD
jgi:hypothetical protein